VMADRGRSGFGPLGKPLDELSDQELIEEVKRRRKRRGVDGKSRTESKTTGARTTSHSSDRSAQYLANLELEPGASAEEIEAAYKRLRAKYEPYTRSQDEKRRSAARTLMDSLQEAFRELTRARD